MHLITPLISLATLLHLTRCAPAPAPVPDTHHVATGVAVGSAVAAGGAAIGAAIPVPGSNPSSSSGSGGSSGTTTTSGNTLLALNYGIPANYKCSADTSDAAVVDFATTPAWNTSMSDCLGELNNEDWNGAECVPKDGQGQALGPAFGFYKGGKNNNGLNCYEYCAPCLQLGIANQRAVTTSCQWGDKSWSCWMGFNYGG